MQTQHYISKTFKLLTHSRCFSLSSIFFSILSHFVIPPASHLAFIFLPPYLSILMISSPPANLPCYHFLP